MIDIMLKGQQEQRDIEEDRVSSSEEEGEGDNDDEEDDEEKGMNEEPTPKSQSRKKRKNIDDNDEERKKAERRAANRAAASRSRQRCKNTIINLQNSVEYLSKENKELRDTIDQLRSTQEAFILENQSLKHQVSTLIGLSTTPSNDDLLRSYLQPGGVLGSTLAAAAAATPSTNLFRSHDMGGIVGATDDSGGSIGSEVGVNIKSSDGNGGGGGGGGGRRGETETSTIKDYLERARLAELAASTSTQTGTGGGYLNDILETMELRRRSLQNLRAPALPGQSCLSSSLLTQLQNNFGNTNGSGQLQLGSGQLQLQESTLASLAAAGNKAGRVIDGEKSPDQEQKETISPEAALLLGRHLQPDLVGANVAQALNVLSQNQYLNSLLASSKGNPSSAELPGKPP